MLKARIGMVAAGVVAAVGLVFVVSSAMASENDEIKKIADLVKKGDMPGAKKLAVAYAKAHSDVDELMTAFKPAKKGGIGVTGSEKGIENVLTQVGRDAPTAANLTKMSDAYAEMGYNIAAVGLITEALAPEKNSGKKTRDSWIEWSKGTIDAGLKLADAAKSKSSADVKTHASKVNTSCNSCHTTFR